MKPVHRVVIHRHSGWLVPLGFALAILGLCALLLAWYLRPSLRGSLSEDDTRVPLSIGGLNLSVPANHIDGRSPRDTVSLFALFPDMRGYSRADAAAFAGNAPDSRVIRILLRTDPHAMPVRQRFNRVWRSSLAKPVGAAGPFGLTQYELRTDSGPQREDLFTADDGAILILCERPLPDLPSPNCLATADPLAPQVGLSWRFKRAMLADWRAVSRDVQRQVARWTVR